MINLKEKVDLSNYTLIVPSVAVGNVGQLTVDLLISSLGLRKIGSIFNSAFIPVLGPDPYSHPRRRQERSSNINDDKRTTTTDPLVTGDLSNNTCSNISSAIDIYLSNGDQAKIVVLQIRSLVTKKPTSFFDELTDFVRENDISDVIILTSSHDHEKTDPQIQTIPLRYVATEKMKCKYHETMESNSWIQLEKKISDSESSNCDSGSIIPGGGFAKDLFETLQNEQIDCAILMKFCSEGDNIPDALSLLHYLNQLVPILSGEKENFNIVYPSSWKFLFGNAPPIEIY